MFVNFVNDVAFFFSRLRVMPRMFLIGYSVLIHLMLNWVMIQGDITSAQAILTSAIITMATPLTKFYIDSGSNLYDHFDELRYTNRYVNIVDNTGYLVDKWRIFPLAFVMHFAISFALIVLWSFGLGDILTNAQATFISIYGGNAALVLGFFITTDNKNRLLEEQYISRYKKRIEMADRIIDIIDNEKGS